MPPPAPQITVTVTDQGALRVAWDIPEPSDGQTEPVEVRLWRRQRRTGTTMWEEGFRRKIGLDPAAGFWDDGSGVHRRDYQFAAETVDADGATAMTGPSWSDLDDTTWAAFPDVTWADLAYDPNLELS